jgi:acetate kinase
MNILVLNCGSSTVKFQLIATDLERIAQGTDRRLARGTIERVGGEAIVNLKVEGGEQQTSTASLRDIRATVDFIARWASSADQRNVALTGGREGLISKDGSSLATYVIPTDEELLIARDTVRCVLEAPQRY